MSANNPRTESRNAVKLIWTQLAEDPNREPVEKETGLYVEGDGTHFSVSSFKKVVFSKLLQRPEFEPTHINVLDAEGREQTVQSLEDVVNDSSLTVIGVTGRLPVGAVNIGTPRNSNSHADLVK